MDGLLKSISHATQYQGDTALTIPPFFQNARREAERIWGEVAASPQPMVINWPGLTDMERTELSDTLSTTNNWILLTHPLGAKNKSQPPLKESQMIARAEGKCSRHKGWWREGKDELATHSMTTEIWISPRGRIARKLAKPYRKPWKRMIKKTTPPSVKKT